MGAYWFFVSFKVHSQCTVYSNLAFKMIFQSIYKRKFLISYFSFLPILNFLIYLFFHWRIIALQNCVGFCQTSTWISHRCTYVVISHPPPSSSHPSRLIQSPCLSFLGHTANSHWLSILHMVIYVSMLLPPYIPPFPSSPHPMSISLLSISLSPLLPCK